MIEQTAALDAHEKYGLPLAFTPAGDRLVTGGFDGSIRTWTVPGFEPDASVAGHEQSVNCGAVTAAGTLVTGSTDATLRAWDLPDLTPRTTLTGHAKTVAGLDAQTERSLVASASYDATVRVWDVEAGRAEATLEGHSKNVTVVTFVGDDSTLVSGGLGDEALVWAGDTWASDPVARLSGHGAAVVGADRLSAGGVVTLGYTGSIREWSAEEWSLERSFELPEGTEPSGLAVEPVDGTLAVTRSGGLLLCSGAGDVVADHAVTIEGVSAPLWSPDGGVLAVGGADGTVRLFE